VGCGIFFGLGQYLRSNLSDSLRRRSQQVEEILAHAPIGVTDAAIAESIDTRVAPDFNNRFVRVTRAPATVIYRSARPADRSFDPQAVSLLTGAWPLKNISRRVVTAQNQSLLLSVTPLDTASGHYLIELGTSLESIEALQERLLGLLGLLLPALVACAAAGGYLLVNWALRPVDRMSQTAAQMSLHNLEARLPVLATGDALQGLSVSLNQMLTRLRDSVQSSRRFLADASHELRTPLTVIKGELQEIVGSEAVVPELGERIGSVLEEVARLEHLVSGLLVISRLDAGEVQREWSDVDLAELTATTAEQMRLMAEDRGIRFDGSALRPTMVRGDRARLKQVVVNLLDNAIRFTPRGGTVTMRTQENDAYDILEVLDTGIGIPAAALPHVFDRFYRVDEARSRDDGGAGLGLSIAKSICASHGARISANSEPGQGSCFRIMFPRLQRAGGRRTTQGGPGEAVMVRGWNNASWPSATKSDDGRAAAQTSSSANDTDYSPKPTALL
jgi:heavy metal sensor kinase